MNCATQVAPRVADRYIGLPGMRELSTLQAWHSPGDSQRLVPHQKCA
jgi:hypothetical protein